MRLTPSFASALAALLLAPLAAFAQTPAATPASGLPGVIPSLIGANLAKNPSFEAGTIVPEDWSVDAGADALSYEPDGGQAGRRCIKVTDAKRFLMQQEIPVLPGATYKVSAQFKTKDFSGKRVWVGPVSMCQLN